MNLTPDQMAHTLSERGHDWADKEAAAQAFEETRKPLRAKLASHFLGEGKAISASEILAEAHPEYQAHVDSMTKARGLALKAKVHYETFKTYVELWRTQESTKRAEMNIR